VRGDTGERDGALSGLDYQGWTIRGWTIRVLRRLAEEGMVKKTAISALQKYIDPIP
jgi:hypothetical protein